MELPELPKPKGWITPGTGTIWDTFAHGRDTLHSGDQMRAYGEQCALAERERCAKLVETENVSSSFKMRELLAAAIRASEPA